MILPVYNAEPYLGECLNSIQQQEHLDWRLLIVDDGSTDGSPAILKEFAEKEDRAVYLHQENRGPGAARNRALGQVSSPWVSFVDSDDILHPQYLRQLLDQGNRLNADLVVGGAIAFHETNGMPTSDGAGILNLPIHLDNRVFNCSDEDFRKRFFAVSLANWGKLYRSDLVSVLRFAETQPGFEDKPFVIGAVKRAHAITYTRQPLYYYRVRAQSAMGILSQKRPNANAVRDFLAVRALCLEELAQDEELTAAYHSRDRAQFAHFFPWVSREDRQRLLASP